ncbi:MAG: flavodoxin [Bacteroides sp.]
MEKVGIFFGSSTGNTEEIANTLKEKLGNAEVFNVAETKPEKMSEFANIILGTSTWGVGDLQDDMMEFAEGIASVDLKGKNVALFGLGDQSGYGDTYCDGMGELYEKLQGKGCNIVGFVSTTGYDFASSRAAEGGEFVGLALDQMNQVDKTEERLNAWVAELQKKFA